MSQHFSVLERLDPSCVPQLSSQGDNYYEWQGRMKFSLRFSQVWEVVSNTRPRSTISADTPSTDTQSGDTLTASPETKHAQWTNDDAKAQAMISAAVHPDLKTLVDTSLSAHQAWDLLKRRFHCDTEVATIHQLRQLVSMKYEEGQDMIQYLFAFRRAWTKLEEHCVLSTHDLARNLKPIFPNGGIKGSFFVATLPETMSSVINNLSKGNINEFTDVEQEMIRFANRDAKLPN
ncbi:hypothetical protein ACQKWADRAFT_302404 [Trichoderma austrokoningii]